MLASFSTYTVLLEELFIPPAAFLPCDSSTLMQGCHSPVVRRLV